MVSEIMLAPTIAEDQDCEDKLAEEPRNEVQLQGACFQIVGTALQTSTRWLGGHCRWPSRKVPQEAPQDPGHCCSLASCASQCLDVEPVLRLLRHPQLSVTTMSEADALKRLRSLANHPHCCRDITACNTSIRSRW